MHRAVAEFVQKQIARSRVGTHLAIKLKRQCDYDVFLLRGDGLFRIDPSYVGEYFRYSLFVATRAHSYIQEITRCAKVI